MRTADFDYVLPPDLIAQEPAPDRSHSRLLVLDRRSGTMEHSRFDSIGHYLHPGDVLVANRTRVIPARIRARRESGGAVELLLLRQQTDDTWESMVKPGRKLRPGEPLRVEDSSLQGVPVQRLPDGNWLVTFTGADNIHESLMAAGTIPLPPYIRDTHAPDSRYQTVFADRDGSVAAPTAGLHFTPALMEGLRASGVDIQFATLHVGAGTFKPVTAERVEEHSMHAEWGEVSRATADAVNQARWRGKRIVAVGTTTTRLLESAWEDGRAIPFSGETDRFIYPGYRFRAIDGLITNFHLPRSTLLMLVSAFAGREAILAAYGEAVHLGYRFYSFGDAMFIR